MTQCRIGMARRDPLVFKFVRDVDISGVSGTGIVADGVVFDDGTSVVHWSSGVAGVEGTTVYRDFASVIKIHGHDGNTRFFFPSGCFYVNNLRDLAHTEELGGISEARLAAFHEELRQPACGRNGAGHST